MVSLTGVGEGYLQEHGGEAQSSLTMKSHSTREDDLTNWLQRLGVPSSADLPQNVCSSARCDYKAMLLGENYRQLSGKAREPLLHLG